MAGDQLAVVDSEARARELTEHRVRKLRDVRAVGAGARTLEQMMQQIKDAGRKEFPLVVKGDVQGSVEAIAGALKKLGTDEVVAQIKEIKAFYGIKEQALESSKINLNSLLIRNLQTEFSTLDTIIYDKNLSLENLREATFQLSPGK